MISLTSMWWRGQHCRGKDKSWHCDQLYDVYVNRRECVFLSSQNPWADYLWPAKPARIRLYRIETCTCRSKYTHTHTHAHTHTHTHIHTHTHRASSYLCLWCSWRVFLCWPNKEQTVLHSDWNNENTSVSMCIQKKVYTNVNKTTTFNYTIIDFTEAKLFQVVTVVEVCLGKIQLVKSRSVVFMLGLLSRVHLIYNTHLPSWLP